MSEEKKLQSLNDVIPIPSSIAMEVFHVFEADDLDSEEEIAELLELMYLHPERDFSLFLPQGETSNNRLKVNLEAFGILSLKTDFYYYHHPEFKQDFVRIEQHQIRFDWERKLVEKAQMYCRTTLALSERVRREIEVRRAMHIEKQRDDNPLMLKPNIWGIGIDLAKIPKWLQRVFRKIILK